MKRILALDGGGIRGMFSLQVLARIEELFRAERNDPNLVLADVFEFMAGTSTGAIIATFLAWGKSVREIEREYVDRGGEMFERERWFRRWKTKYRAEAIARYFREAFSEDDAPALLGTAKLRTQLLVVVRNASTGAAWPVSNIPQAMFNDPARPDCNLNIPLWQLLRASCAAPSYFPPQAITLNGRIENYIDGGLTAYNNPALIAVLMATLPCYKLGWPAGRESLLVVSVGTGLERATLPHKAASDIHLLDQVKHLAPALIGSAATEQDMLCRIIGDCVHGPPLDAEIGSLDQPTLFPKAEQKFTYVRYNQSLAEAFAKRSAGPGTAPRLDDLSLIPLLQEEGRLYAARAVQSHHFRPQA